MQVVNFYTAEFQPDRSPLRAAHIAWVLVCACLLLILYSVWYQLQTGRVLQQLAAQEAQTQAAQATLIQKLEHQKSLNLQDVKAQLEQARRSIGQRKLALNLISTQDMGNTSGFSWQMRELAAQAQPSVSLQWFVLLAGGGRVELGGVTSEPKAVPRYVALLHGTPAFSRSSFGVLKLDQNTGSGFPFALTAPTKQEAAGEAP